MAGKKRTQSARVKVAAGPAVLDRPAVRWALLAVGVWLILAVTYPDAMFGGQVFGSADAGNAEAFGAVGDAELGDGDYPLWNPYLFAGMPTFGSLAYTRFLYPPATLFNFLQQRLGFVPLTWMFGHLLFGGLGMVWLLSRWRLPAAAVLLGVAAFLLFPKVVAWGVHGHGSKLGAAMYLPWLVGWTLRVLGGGGARAVGMVGLLLGLQLLRGHVQITYYTLLVLGWLSLWNTWAPLDRTLAAARAALRWRRLGLVAGGLALGFLVGAVLLVPVHEYAGISIRGQDTAGGGGVGLDYATGWSLAPAETGTFVLPAAAGFGRATYMGFMPFNDYPNYFGVLLLTLAAAAWLRPVRSFTVAGLIVALVAVAVAFGNHGFGLYEFLYAHLPYFNKFRVPSMVLVLPAFMAAILAARGAAALADAERPVRPLKVGAMVLAGVGAIMLIAGATGLAEDPYRSALTGMAEAAGRQPAGELLDEAWSLHRGSLIRIGLILLTAAAAAWTAVRRADFRARGLVWVWLALVVLDLQGVGRLIVHPDAGLVQVARTPSGGARLIEASPLLRNHVPAETAAPGGAELAAAVGHDRVWPLGRLGGQNLWMTARVHSLGGYHAAKLARFEAVRSRLFGDRPAGRIASWLGARGVVFERPLTANEITALGELGSEIDPRPESMGPYTLHRNRSALPRARMVSQWRPVSALPEKDDLPSFLDAVQDGAVDVASVVHLDREPSPPPAAVTEALPAPEFVRDAMDEVVLRTTADVPALLLLADMAAPGWKVEIDGAEAELLTADLILRAVAVPAGEHEVRFHYADPTVRAGLTMTIVGAILAAGLILAPLVPGRRRGGPVAAAEGDEDE